MRVLARVHVWLRIARGASYFAAVARISARIQVPNRNADNSTK